MVGFLGFAGSVNAADRYWVGGTANWDGTAGSKWSETSGGAGGQAIPTSADNCYFNASSTGTVSIASGNTGCGNIDLTGFAGTLAGSGALTVSGSLTLGAGMTRTYTGTITFNATTSTSTITSNGIALNNPITFNGVGGLWQLADDFTTGLTRTVTLTNGTFDANGKNVTMGIFSSSNTNTRTITMGSGIWTITGNGTTVWNTSTNDGLTIVKGNPIKFNYSGSTGTRTISNGYFDDTNNIPDIEIVSGGDTISLSSSSDFNSIDFTGFSGTLITPTTSNISISGNLIFSPTMSLSSVSTPLILGRAIRKNWGQWTGGCTRFKWKNIWYTIRKTKNINY